MAKPASVIFPSDDVLIDLHHTQGLRLSQVSKTLNIEYETLRKHFRKRQIEVVNYYKKEVPSKEELIKHHKVDRLSLDKIAQGYGVSHSLVSQWFKKYGIEIDTIRSKRIEIPSYEVIYQKYSLEKLTKVELAEYFNVSRETIGEWFDHYQIETVNNYVPQNKITLDKAELFDLHVNKKWSIDKVARHFDVTWGVVKRSMDAYNIETYFYKVSDAEKEIGEYISSLGFEWTKTRKLFDDRKEIDLYIPSKNLAIEYCGLYWHSEQRKPFNEHYEKMKLCSEKGIQLLTIFEDEWLEKQEIVKSVIASKLGVFQKRIYARECEVQFIDKKTCNEFLKRTHVQGSVNHITHAIGLFYENELVGVMSIGPHHRKGFKELVLNRMSFQLNTQIVGGASRLWKFFLKNTDADRVISWSDNRWSNGNIYHQLGFKKDGSLRPDYSYVNGNQKRYSKQSQKKSVTGCPPHITEKQWCSEKGLSRIWDCGKIRWSWNRD